MPTSRLEAITQALQAAVVGPEYAFGVRELRTTTKLPRVVWVPTRDTFDSSEHFGDAPADAPRQVRTCTAGLEVHLWGTSVAQVEALRDALITAAHDALGADLEVVAGEWLTQRPDVASYANTGEVYLLSLTVATPVTGDAPTTVTIEAVDIDPTGAVAGDGILQSGET